MGNGGRDIFIVSRTSDTDKGSVATFREWEMEAALGFLNRNLSVLSFLRIFIVCVSVQGVRLMSDALVYVPPYTRFRYLHIRHVREFEFESSRN